jgi:plastocyanin
LQSSILPSTARNLRLPKTEPAEGKPTRRAENALSTISASPVGVCEASQSGRINYEEEFLSRNLLVNFFKETNVKETKKNMFADFGSKALWLFAWISVVTLCGLSAWSALKPADNTGTAQSASGGANSAIEVNIDNFAFTPGVITVKAGTQVTWVNHDDIPHTVDSTEGKFKSAPLDTNDKFEFRFTQPGEYPFYCRMHPKMTGKIIVQQ